MALRERPSSRRFREVAIEEIRPHALVASFGRRTCKGPTAGPHLPDNTSPACTGVSVIVLRAFRTRGAQWRGESELAVLGPRHQIEVVVGLVADRTNGTGTVGEAHRYDLRATEAISGDCVSVLCCRRCGRPRLRRRALPHRLGYHPTNQRAGPLVAYRTAAAGLALCEPQVMTTRRRPRRWTNPPVPFDRTHQRNEVDAPTASKSRWARSKPTRRSMPGFDCQSGRSAHGTVERRRTSWLSRSFCAISQLLRGVVSGPR